MRGHNRLKSSAYDAASLLKSTDLRKLGFDLSRQKIEIDLYSVLPTHNESKVQGCSDDNSRSYGTTVQSSTTSVEKAAVQTNFEGGEEVGNLDGLGQIEIDKAWPSGRDIIPKRITCD